MVDIVAQYLHGLEQDRLRRSIRKNIKPKVKPRDSGKLRWQPDDTDDESLPSSERVMPPGERERRRTNESLAQSLLVRDSGAADGGSEAPAEGEGEAKPEPVEAGERGVVVEVSQGLCRVQVGAEVLLCATARGAQRGLDRLHQRGGRGR